MPTIGKGLTNAGKFRWGKLTGKFAPFQFVSRRLELCVARRRPFTGRAGGAPRVSSSLTISRPLDGRPAPDVADNNGKSGEFPIQVGNPCLNHQPPRCIQHMKLRKFHEDYSWPLARQHAFKSILVTVNGRYPDNWQPSHGSHVVNTWYRKMHIFVITSPKMMCMRQSWTTRRHGRVGHSIDEEYGCAKAL